MTNGERAYNGKILSVDLNACELKAEQLADEFYRSYLGGYGAGARLLFDRIPKGTDPLGPANVIGFMPGLLSGTPFFGNRFAVVGKSPKTGGWGDANGGGDFGPWLKNAGWDGVLVSGISSKPVYILIDDDKAELRDASDLWGLDAIETEARLKERHGKKTSVACIGPAGERLSLMAGVCNDRGRVAARSGLGAVMGSKRLKAVAVVASRSAILARDKEVQGKVREALDGFSKGLVQFFHTSAQRESGLWHRLRATHRSRTGVVRAQRTSRRRATWTALYARRWRDRTAAGTVRFLRRREQGVGQPEVPVPSAYPSGGVRDDDELRRR